MGLTEIHDVYKDRVDEDALAWVLHVYRLGVEDGMDLANPDPVVFQALYNTMMIEYDAMMVAYNTARGYTK